MRDMFKNKYIFSVIMWCRGNLDTAFHTLLGYFSVVITVLMSFFMVTL